MPKVLALDVGKKRTGVAETDPFQIIATGLPTIETSQLLPFLKNYIEKEAIETLIVGEPKRMHGVPSDIEAFISPLIIKIQKLHPALKIERVDERFTSKMASQAISESNLPKKKRQNKALIDEISAVIILQTWMNRML